MYIPFPGDHEQMQFGKIQISALKVKQRVISWKKGPCQGAGMPHPSLYRSKILPLTLPTHRNPPDPIPHFAFEGNGYKPIKISIILKKGFHDIPWKEFKDSGSVFC